MHAIVNFFIICKPSFVDFCLIPYPRPIPLTFQPQDGFISIVFDVSPECCLFDRVQVDNQPVLRSLQRYYIVVRKKDDRNKKN